MRWFEKLARFWEKREQAWRRNRPPKNNTDHWVRIIYDRESREPYLIRYFILSTRWLFDDFLFQYLPWTQRAFKWVSFRLVLHRTLRSDIDGFHDHPWPWMSMILSGGYWEHTPRGRFWRAPGTMRFRSANSYHRLELDPNTRKEVWSLFLMGPRQKDWGFLDRTGTWVQWEEYLDNRDKYFLA